MKEINPFDLDSYNYSLPKELIAQYPCEKRDESKLLFYKEDKDEISHHRFYELSKMLSKNDVLVLNNTKVIPARFYGKTENDKEIEILLVNSVSPDNLTWKILASPRKHLNKVSEVKIKSSMSSSSLTRGSSHNNDSSSHLDSRFRGNDNNKNEITINITDPDTIKFNSHNDLELILNQIGTTPLPPYIKRAAEDIDINRYQTIFAKEPGAVAAPTAALHFTEELLNKIKNQGTEILYITLHVGPGTFLPIRTEDIREHKLIPERYYIDDTVWKRILEAKKNKKRIIACGTTTIRTLEYVALSNKLSGLNGLYITPEFKFQIVDALITNFHLPKTSLLVLISAFIGWENVRKIYDEAIKEKYRFFSYGDGMLVS